MPAAIVDSPEIQDLVDRIAGLDQEAGDARLKTIVRRVVGDLFRTIEELEVDEDEFWHALHFLQASAPELPLIAPGLGFDHFLDVLMDEADREAGVAAGTPRTIEGPLYVEGAPIADGHADMTTNEDGERIEIEGVVSDAEDRPAGAIVDIWHANTRGAYSHFDPSQPAFNYRRRVRTGADGRYRVSSIMPSGYAVPPGGSTEMLLDGLGRHGHRPAHVHFFVSAPGYRHLTTQINIDGDPYLHDDFAFATRDELIVAPEKRGDATVVGFDFVLLPAADAGDEQRSERQRAQAA